MHEMKRNRALWLQSSRHVVAAAELCLVKSC